MGWSGGARPLARTLSTAVFAFGVLLGALALVLIVTADGQKQMAVGMIVGLWGLFLAALSETGRWQQFEPRLRAILRQEVERAVHAELGRLRDGAPGPGDGTVDAAADGTVGAAADGAIDGASGRHARRDGQRSDVLERLLSR